MTAPTENPFAFSGAEAPPAPPAQPPAAPPAAPPAQPPAAPAAPAAGDDPFSGPAPQLPRGPRLLEMYGRLLLMIPHKLEQGVPNRLANKPGEVQDRMTADVIILDGGPISYGGKPEKTPPVPHDKTAQVPHKNERMYISSVGLISQNREALAKRLAGQPGMVLGRLAKGESTGNQEAPWILTPPTDADKAVARGYLATVDPFA